MAPNLKVELLALHDQLHSGTNEESTIDITNLLLNKEDHHHIVVQEAEEGDPKEDGGVARDDHVQPPPPPPIDSDSYWDWPSTDVVPTNDDEVIIEATTTTKKKNGYDVQPPAEKIEDGEEEEEMMMMKGISEDGANSSGNSTLDETIKTTTSASAGAEYYWAERNYDEDIDTKFYIDYSREMGRGGAKGVVVRKAIERKTGKRFAVKTYSKRKYSEQDVKHEAAMMMMMMMMCTCDGGGGGGGGGHPNIAQCYGTYQDSNYYHIVMEYIAGGELYDLVIERATTTNNNKKKKKKKQEKNLGCCAVQQPFTEPEAARILQQVLSAVDHCHSCGVVHRDLKLENLMIVNKNKKKNKTTRKNKNKKNLKNLDIKVIDFGLAARIPNGQDQPNLIDRVGTNYYVAPEVLSLLSMPSGGGDVEHGYNESVDVWSVGVIAYTLFCAMPPFRGVTEMETYDLIRTKQVDFTNQPVWESVSPQAKEFILSCLQKDPKVRPSAEALLQNEWLQQQSAAQLQHHQEEEEEENSSSAKNNKRFLHKIKKALHLS